MLNSELAGGPLLRFQLMGRVFKLATARDATTGASTARHASLSERAAPRARGAAEICPAKSHFLSEQSEMSFVRSAHVVAVRLGRKAHVGHLLRSTVPARCTLHHPVPPPRRLRSRVLYHADFRARRRRAPALSAARNAFSSA